MRWGPQEKGMREEPREEGEEGHGREDEMTDDGWPLGRAGDSIQSMDHWTRGEGGWRARQSAGAGRAQKRGARTPCPAFHSLVIHHSLNQHIMSIRCTLVTQLDTGEKKHHKIQHGSVGCHSKAHSASSSEGTHR